MTTFRRTLWASALLLACGLALAAVVPAASQSPSLPPAKTAPPRLEPVAETRLLMEALANPNYRGLERLLRQKPDQLEAWKFARGQALLLAETANLLLLRPPRSVPARRVWFDRAVDLRRTARELAETAGRGDFERSRAALVSLANACNRCHQTFRIAVEIVPFEEPAPKKPG